MAANSSTFTCFAKLPKPLREKIWAAAIRPAQPGVHYFTIYNGDDEKERSTIGDDAAFVVVYPEDCDMSSTVAAPRCNRSEPNARSWIASNPSTYLIDGGLLTACKESREAMNKHLRAVEPWDRINSDNYNQEKDPDAAVTASLVQDGERRYFRNLTTEGEATLKDVRRLLPAKVYRRKLNEEYGKTQAYESVID
ncbi:hypothetical protein DL770_003937 [Monosporascus sp. CRB-9-2]|nr:hypothetical protein DL770_003937 [Monosporascus sp. CRB-9-2]